MQRYERKPVPTMATIASGYQVVKMFDHYAGVMVLVGHNRAAAQPWACWKWDARNGHVAARYFRREAEANTLMLHRIREIMTQE